MTLNQLLRVRGSRLTDRSRRACAKSVSASCNYYWRTRTLCLRHSRAKALCHHSHASKSRQFAGYVRRHDGHRPLIRGDQPADIAHPMAQVLQGGLRWASATSQMDVGVIRMPSE